MTDWDHDVDVVVLGSGGAGLTAALTAAVHGASVQVYEKSATVGGTTAVSGGIMWIPAHKRSSAGELTPEDAMAYLRAQSLGYMDDELVETFVHTGADMLDFVEAHSDLRFEVAQGFPDYKPELPGGQPGGGRSLNTKPFDLAELGEWRDRITTFPADFSNVGIDAETRARIHAAVDDESGDYCVAGTSLIAGLLKALLDAGVMPRTGARAVELVADPLGIIGVRIEQGDRDFRVRARRGVVLGTGGFEWDERLVEAYLRGPMRGAVSPPNNTGDGLRMAMAHGADLANMGEAWWVPVIQIPGDTYAGHPRSRSVRLERTRPRSIIVNRAGRRFLNEAGEYNSMAGPFHFLDPKLGYANDPAW
ncbi:MAG: FAD-dependent oxidoreductase, partial [Actinomycetota bacterium]|nr:FAD-dependent oxidoreductase [Actinomycetota bacterium]